MTMTRTLPLLAALVAALALPGAAGAKERKNPYTATGVCGPGFKKIDSRRLVDSNFGKLLSEVVLTYNARTGQNCTVNLKRYRVGLKEKSNDWMWAETYTRPTSIQSNLSSNTGDFAYFAGPTYVQARGKCVQWGGGAALIVEPNRVPRGEYHSAFRSRWSHCN